MVSLYVPFLCTDWSKFDRWVHAEKLCSILKLVYLDSWSWQSFMSSCDVFNCLFPLDKQNEKQLLSGLCCYSWLVCLLGFWLRNAPLVKIIGNSTSDGIVPIPTFVPWCVKECWKDSTDSGLTWWWLSEAASRLAVLSNYCNWCLFFFLFFLYHEAERSLCYMIWDNDLTYYQVWYTYFWSL